MLSTAKQKTIVGLDVEAGSIAAAEVGADGHSVAQVAIAPLGGDLIREGEVVDPSGLSEALRSLFGEHKLSKSVRLGIANQRVAVRTIRLPMIEDPDELETAVRFQAQEQLPMPLDQAVLDHQVVARYTGEDGSRGMEVVAVAARRDMLETLLGAVRGAGLRPVGIDLSAFALIRGLVRDQPQEQPAAAEQNGDGEQNGDIGSQPVAQPAVMYCNLGDVTNLAVARGSSCVFTRISPFGVEAIAQRLAERRTLSLDHARQWLVHVGMERSIAEIDGDDEVIVATRETLEEGASKLADELRLSLDFYGAQEGVPPVERIVVTGPGSTIPGLTDRLQTGLGQPFSIGRPAALSGLDDAAVARLTVSYGLGLEQ
jgi:type IV pilus assembly protein PilM